MDIFGFDDVALESATMPAFDTTQTSGNFKAVPDGLAQALTGATSNTVYPEDTVYSYYTGTGGGLDTSFYPERGSGTDISRMMTKSMPGLKVRRYERLALVNSNLRQPVAA